MYINMKTTKLFKFKYSSNKKLELAFKNVFQSIIEKYYDYDSYWYENKDQFINELKRYKNDFKNELDYNYYQYWNLLIYNHDINKLFLDSWYKRLYWNEINRYKYLVKRSIDLIIHFYDINELDIMDIY